MTIEPEPEWDGIDQIGGPVAAQRTLTSASLVAGLDNDPDMGPDYSAQLDLIARGIAALATKFERLVQLAERQWGAIPVQQIVPPQPAPVAPVAPQAWALPQQGGTSNIAQPPQPSWVCPLHGTPAKWIPPGTSTRTQKPYNGFWACSTPQCRERVR